MIVSPLSLVVGLLYGVAGDAAMFDTFCIFALILFASGSVLVLLGKGLS